MPEKTEEKQRPAHLYKPGQSGNPAGRPKGTKNFTTQLKEYIKSEGADEEIRQAILKKMKEGDFQFIKTFWEQLDGKPHQTQEVDLGEETIKSINIIKNGGNN